jgi:hypothetical protein
MSSGISSSVEATPITNTLFGAFFLALDRLQHLPPGDGTEVGEGVAMADPAAVECMLRHWTLGLVGVLGLPGVLALVVVVSAWGWHWRWRH